MKRKFSLRLLIFSCATIFLAGAVFFLQQPAHAANPTPLPLRMSCTTGGCTVSVNNAVVAAPIFLDLNVTTLVQSGATITPAQSLSTSWAYRDFTNTAGARHILYSQGFTGSGSQRQAGNPNIFVLSPVPTGITTFTLEYLTANTNSPSYTCQNLAFNPQGLGTMAPCGTTLVPPPLSNTPTPPPTTPTTRAGGGGGGGGGGGSVLFPPSTPATPTPEEPCFPDLTPEQEVYACFLHERGYLRGVPVSEKGGGTTYTYAANDIVTRDQLFTLLARYLYTDEEIVARSNAIPAVNIFPDMPRRIWFRDPVRALYPDVVKGRGDGTLAPGSPVLKVEGLKVFEEAFREFIPSLDRVIALSEGVQPEPWFARYKPWPNQEVTSADLQNIGRVLKIMRGADDRPLRRDDLMQFFYIMIQKREAL